MHKKLISELKALALAFAAAMIIMKAAYSGESTAVVAKTTASLFWLFVIPGYAVTLYWREKLGAIERLAAGTIAAMAATGILSYYLGIAGLKIQNQTIILPAAIIAASLAVCLKPWAGKSRQTQKEQTPQELKA